MNFLVFLLYILAYLLIIFRPKTASVTTFLIAISSLIVLNNTNFENIGEIVDFNTLLILFGMMVIVSVMKEKGVFIGVSNAIIDFSKGNFFKMLVLINVGVFFLSGFLDNVTTILIFFPILFYLSDVLNLDSRVLGLNAILFSNIGGMSTAIGDPPNIVIYSVSKIPFLDFITNIMPIALILLIIQLVILRKGIKFEQTSFQRQERNVVNKNWKYYLLYFIGVIFLMAFHDKFKLELGFITILSGLTLLFFESEDFNSRIQDIDWDMLFLISGLYILNWSIEHTKIFDILVFYLMPLKGSVILPLLILWVSIFSSGFIGALPTTLIFITIIKKLTYHMPVSLLYWSLVLGVGIGGNLTPIASMCNIIGNNLIRKLKNEYISFSEFTKNMLKPVLYGAIISSVFIVFKWYI